MRKALSVCFYFLVVIFLAIGCGGGGGDGGGGNIVVPTVTPPSQSLVGTYKLNGFKINYSNGVTATEKNFTSFSGTMKIVGNRMAQTIVIANNTVNAGGYFSITYTNGTSEGILHITDDIGGIKHDASFATSGNLFHVYSGVLRASNGLLYEEWDYWEKTSDVVGIVSGVVEEQAVQSPFKFIGDILIENNLIVTE